MALTWTVAKVGSGSVADKRTALRMIRAENARLTALNLILAAQTPPGTPLPLMLFGTNAQIETSAEILAGRVVASWWDSSSAEAASPTALKERLTAAEEVSIVTAAIDRLDGGTTVAALLTDIAS